jgi:hypothetical protein
MIGTGEPASFIGLVSSLVRIRSEQSNTWWRGMRCRSFELKLLNIKIMVIWIVILGSSVGEY